ncbi:hypothetical protein [Actinotalea sp. C106]|uniref:hypothetical protein n=1 Tax=Actinotalea sp. C106 TaxID=2908644 RepID=UPI002028AC70|nr:hypothetical protein [Actinotalea sp. C106]
MTNVDVVLNETLAIEGAVAAALVDYESGMSLGQVGHGVDLDIAAAGNTDVIRAKLRTMERLGLDDTIEDILITLGKQYHLIRLIQSQGGLGLFLYVVLTKGQANLALARRQLANIERRLEI